MVDRPARHARGVERPEPLCIPRDVRSVAGPGIRFQRWLPEHAYGRSGAASWLDRRTAFPAGA
jgi:hypothetical protein